MRTPQRFGPWPFGYYELGLKGDPDTALAYGIWGYKKTLVRAVEKSGIALPDPYERGARIGAATVQACRTFQSANGLKADGVAGPATARALVMPLLINAERKYEVPDRLAARVVSLESGFGFGAVGDNGTTYDRFLAQINSGDRTVTDAQAADPAFSTAYAARRLSRSFDELVDWDAAIFSHNAPAWAPGWLAAGKPAVGGGTVTVGKRQVDKWAWATQYVHDVRAQQV